VSLDAMMDLVAKQVGYVEGRGNITKYGAWYPLQGGAWCAMGLSWCAEFSGNRDAFPKHAYTPIGAAWGKANGRWHTTSPRRGDLAYFWSPTKKRIAHVGIVTGVRADGSVETIEFNTSGPGGSQDNGGMVLRKVRAAAAAPGTSKYLRICGYVRPNYTPAPVISPPSAPPVLTPQPVQPVRRDPITVLPELSKGDRSEHVKLLQGLLATHLGVPRGYTFATWVDGRIGNDTDAAIKRFQEGRRIKANGVVGPVTWAHLLNAAT
jgi:hypothetical protein